MFQTSVLIADSSGGVVQDRSWTAEAKQEQQKRKSNLGGEPTSSARQFRRVDLRAICVMPSTSTLQEENGTVAPNKSTVERKPPVRNGRGWETSNPRIDSESYHACTRPKLASHLERTTNHRPSYVRRTTGSLRPSLGRRRRASMVLEDAPVVRRSRASWGIRQRRD